ncbi:MAG TPA: hypothetical protein VLT45_27925 [Kofleriaceae bacterium]|nr:hypothetical protein [Kofleriaceae bacterium]
MRRLLISLVCLVTCASCVFSCASAESPRGDAPPSSPPIDPTGTFALRTSLHLAAPLPGPATAFLADVRAATDDPDDPSRFLVDKLISELPDGRTKTIAAELAPFLAAYLDARLAETSPRLLPGMHAVSNALASFSQELQPIEELRIAPDAPPAERTSATGDHAATFATDHAATFATDHVATVASDHAATIAITGLRIGKLDVPLALGGIPEPAVAVRVTYEAGALTVGAHRLALPYSRLVRLALDRGIIPAVDPQANDLPTLLVDLVDCDHVGATMAEGVGVGPASVYADACVIALRAVAAEWYEHLDALDGMTIDLAIAGDARALDLDGDGRLDAIANGIWTGTLADVSVAGSTFEGNRE